MVHGNTDVGYFYSTSILGAKSYSVCFLIKGVKLSSSINCQLTDVVCSHDKVPNWPSIVFCFCFVFFGLIFLSSFSLGSSACLIVLWKDFLLKKNLDIEK